MSEHVAADRRHLPVQLLAALVIIPAMALGLAAQSAVAYRASSPLVAIGALAAGAVGVLALRSLSVALVARTVCLASGVLMLWLGSPTTGRPFAAVSLLAWAALVGAALVLASSTGRYVDPPDARRDRPFRPILRPLVAVPCIITAVGLLGGRLLPDSIGGGGDRLGGGETPEFDAGTASGPLAGSRELDMTNRPRLSDAIVMTVRTDRPSYWRTQTYDDWDGTTWTSAASSGRRVTDPSDLEVNRLDRPALDGQLVRQEFQVEAPFAIALPSTPVTVSVDAPRSLISLDNGSVGVASPLGAGDRYTTESRVLDLDVPTLQATEGGTIPAAARRFAEPPTATDRVAELAEQITASAPTAVDKVLAIEAWLADNTEYSLDAPLSPPGEDVVDHFLFESRLGWCEQVASSLTVLLRLSGVPARVAAGFVPEGRDALTGRWIVRERDAHAWTEVWFPDVGWVAFDPTANLSVAGTLEDGSGSADVVLLVLAATLGALGLAVLAGPPLVRRIRRWRAERRRRADLRRRRAADLGTAEATDWPDLVDLRLDEVGTRWGRPRAPAETSTTYADDLSVRTGHPPLAEVGRTADRVRYGPAPSDPREAAAVQTARSTATAILGSVPGPPEGGAPEDGLPGVRPPARR